MGIKVVGAGVVKDCMVESNIGTGITVGEGSTVSGCSVRNNGNGTVGNGITAGAGSTLTNTTVSESKDNGIVTGAGSKVTNCTVTKSGGHGIDLAIGSQATECTVNENGGDGIIARDRNVVKNSHIYKNARSGIWAPGANSRLEGNNLVENTRNGMAVGPGQGNLTLRNTAKANAGGNYSIGSGNMTPTIVSTEAALNSATNSNVNISH